MGKRLALHFLLLLGLIGLFTGCEVEDEATIKVVNYMERVVVLSLNGNEIARVQPLTHKEEEIEKGTYKVALKLDDGRLLFEQTIFIDELQFVTYTVRADGTVLASGGDDDPDT
jgi:hypothetical protein